MCHLHNWLCMCYNWFIQLDKLFWESLLGWTWNQSLVLWGKELKKSTAKLNKREICTIVHCVIIFYFNYSLQTYPSNLLLHCLDPKVVLCVLHTSTPPSSFFANVSISFTSTSFLISHFLGISFPGALDNTEASSYKN